MSTLDYEIALQSSKIIRGRQAIRQKKLALHDGAVGLLKQPRTLVAAFLTGAVAARLYPALYARKHLAAADAGYPPVRGRIMTTVRLMLFSLASTWFKEALKQGVSPGIEPVQQASQNSQNQRI
jgi:hypothetical protein